MMPVRQLFVTLSVWLFLAAPAFGQFLGLTTPQSTQAAPAAQQPSVPADPLGRETPRGTILGFLKAAQDERFNVATQYFQPQVSRRRHSQEDDEEIAAQLLVIFNQKLSGALDLASRDPPAGASRGRRRTEALVFFAGEPRQGSGNI
jgi:MscS family membrane protein